jgi:hypothetical protein
METDMNRSIQASAAKFVVAILAITAVLAITAGAASAVTYTPIYKNIPAPLPGNVPSQPFQAQQASEFGGQVEVSGASANNTKVTVAMSSWACQSGTWNEGTCVTTAGAKFEWPVTLKIYLPKPDNSVGPQIAQLTQTFKMPYRPSANPTKCTGGRWYSYGKCFNGKLFKIVFPLKGVYLSDNAIISVVYNTSGYGPEPQGYGNLCNTEPQGCPYDSLNVGVEDPTNPVFATSPFTGTQPLPNDAYINSATAGVYCDGGAGGTGTFRLEGGPGCWTGMQPLFEVATG